MLPDADWLTLDFVERVAVRWQQTVDLDVSNDPRLHSEGQRHKSTNQQPERQTQLSNQHFSTYRKERRYIWCKSHRHFHLVTMITFKLCVRSCLSEVLSPSLTALHMFSLEINENKPETRQ